MNKTFFYVNKILKRAHSLDLAEIEENQHELENGQNLTMLRYTLNSKGLDCVLRLEEMENNQRRHNKTLGLTKCALLISFLAMLISLFSAFLTYEKTQTVALYSGTNEEGVQNPNKKIEKQKLLN